MDMSSETVIMVSHDIDGAIYLADRILVMTNGPTATDRRGRHHGHGAGHVIVAAWCTSESTLP
jgi:ABC-type nitrate/sulfonate/bicarbonate transport system ATPase subunit